MSLPKIGPPLDYMREASPASLQSFELSRLNHAANLRREIAALIDQWIEETSEALLARWMIDHRNSLHPSSLPSPDRLSSFREPELPLSPSSPAPTADILPAPPRFADPPPSISRSLERKSQKHRSTA